MSAIYNQLLMHYRDASGKEATSYLTTQDQSDEGTAPYVALAVALQNCSDCAVTAIQLQTTLLAVGATTDGAYNTVFDRGVLFGTITGTGQPTRLPIVGPKESIFQAGHALIDMSNPDVVALVAEALAVLGSRDGVPVASYTRGRRQEAKPTA